MYHVGWKTQLSYIRNIRLWLVPVQCSIGRQVIILYKSRGELLISISICTTHITILTFERAESCILQSIFFTKFTKQNNIFETSFCMFHQGFINRKLILLNVVIKSTRKTRTLNRPVDPKLAQISNSVS